MNNSIIENICTNPHDCYTHCLALSPSTALSSVSNILNTRNTCMQQPLAFISKHCVNMKYFRLYQQ